MTDPGSGTKVSEEPRPRQAPPAQEPREGGSIGRRVVEAQDVVKGLTEADDEVAFVLRGKTVSGQLVLKHRKVAVAVEIRDPLRYL